MSPFCRGWQRSSSSRDSGSAPGPYRLLLTVGLGFAAGASPSGAAGPVQTYVPEAVACSDCRVEVKTLVEIGAPDGPASLPGGPLHVRQDGRGRYWVVVPEEPPMVFDSEGQYVTTVGRRGEGPQEFGLPIDVIPLPGDSVLVLDNRLKRASVVGPDLQIVRTIPVPLHVLISGTAASWPDNVILNGLLYDAARAGWPLHSISFETSPPEITASFGANHGELRPGDIARSSIRRLPLRAAGSGPRRGRGTVSPSGISPGA